MSQHAQMIEILLSHDKGLCGSDGVRVRPRGPVLLTFDTSRGLGNSLCYPYDTPDITRPGIQAGHNLSDHVPALTLYGGA